MSPAEVVIEDRRPPADPDIPNSRALGAALRWLETGWQADILASGPFPAFLAVLRWRRGIGRLREHRLQR